MSELDQLQLQETNISFAILVAYVAFQAIFLIGNCAIITVARKNVQQAEATCRFRCIKSVKLSFVTWVSLNLIHVMFVFFNSNLIITFKPETLVHSCQIIVSIHCIFFGVASTFLALVFVAALEETFLRANNVLSHSKWLILSLQIATTLPNVILSIGFVASSEFVALSLKNDPTNSTVVCGPKPTTSSNNWIVAIIGFCVVSAQVWLLFLFMQCLKKLLDSKRTEFEAMLQSVQQAQQGSGTHVQTMIYVGDRMIDQGGKTLADFTDKILYVQTKHSILVFWYLAWTLVGITLPNLVPTFSIDPRWAAGSTTLVHGGIVFMLFKFGDPIYMKVFGWQHNRISKQVATQEVVKQINEDINSSRTSSSRNEKHKIKELKLVATAAES